MIEVGRRVKIHYSLCVDGSVVESTWEPEPFEYIQGQTHLIPEIQKKLEGLKAGEESCIALPPKRLLEISTHPQ